MTVYLIMPHITPQLGGILFSNIIAFVALLFSIRAFPLNKELSLIHILLIISVVISGFNFYHAIILGEPILMIGILYRYAEFLYLVYFYTQILNIQIDKKYIISVLLTLTFVAFVKNVHDVVSMRSLNAIVFIVLSFVAYGKMLLELKAVDVTKDSVFWVNNAVFCYFTGTFFLFLLNDYLVKNHFQEYRYLWMISNFLAVVKNSMIAYAFWLWKNRNNVNKNL